MYSFGLSACFSLINDLRLYIELKSKDRRLLQRKGLAGNMRALCGIIKWFRCVTFCCIKRAKCAFWWKSFQFRKALRPCASTRLGQELSFNLVKGQLYLLTYVNEYRGGPWAKKHTLNQFHIAAPEFLRGRKNETWRNLVIICSHICPVCNLWDF